MSLAQAYERRTQLAVPATPSPSWRPSDTLTSVPGTGTTNNLGSGALSPTACLPHRTPSPAELEHRRAQGLCYRCDKKFVADHQCKRLFIIEVQPDLDSNDEYPQAGREPEISLAALMGIQP